MTEMLIPTYNDVLSAVERIKPHVHRTPVLTSSYFNRLTGAELFFKCENFQKAGVFKARGASNAVFGLDDEQAEKGVATHSSGNHGLSLSYAAGRRGIKATVVMPRTAPEAKKDAVRGYGADVVECEPSTSSREAVFAEVVASSGADFVHPYNDPRHNRERHLSLSAKTFKKPAFSKRAAPPTQCLVLMMSRQKRG